MAAACTISNEERKDCLRFGGDVYSQMATVSWRSESRIKMINRISRIMGDVFGMLEFVAQFRFYLI
ncbi:MAG: hypothetical protein NWR65_11420 [Saprospiraceae bacterium]|nr:hypothetical protein [Saprospiraceae bacterium]